MFHTRRHFMTMSAAALGSVTVLPYAVRAAGHGGDVFVTAAGDITIHPVSHASLVMATPVGTIHVDPVGDPAAYGAYPAPDLVLLTHQHGDHYNADTLAALVADETRMVTNPAVLDMLPNDLKAKATSIANGEATTFREVGIDAIPAYNFTEGRTQFHPEGRDNGYVLGFDGFRVYVSGDTEDTPEMRALENIDVAFVSMNLPFTMDAAAAASAVAEFRPRHVYPYHYRGRGPDGTQDPAEFARLVGDAADVKIGNWFG